MNFYPKVSIIIPVYNGSNYMAEAIESAINQTYKNIEVLVINDGSNDDGKTHNIALRYGERIRYFKKENGGVASALNLGIEKMEGDYFSWLSHDDVYFKEKIEKQIEFLRRKGIADLILYSNLQVIDEKSEFIKTDKLSGQFSKEQISLILFSRINACTMLIPRICLEKTGRFNMKLKTTQDYDLIYRLMKNYDFYHLKNVLIKSREHREQGFKTIVTHHDEKTMFFIDLLNKINIGDYKKVKQPLFLLFIKAAIHFRKTQLQKVAEYSIQLSKSNFKKNLYNKFRYSYFYFIFKNTNNPLFIKLSESLQLFKNPELWIPYFKKKFNILF